jgi:hypothetical protein
MTTKTKTATTKKAPKAKAAPAAKPLSAEEAKLLSRCRNMAARLRHRVRTMSDKPGHYRLTSMTDKALGEFTLKQLAAQLEGEIEKKAEAKAAPAQASA